MIFTVLNIINAIVGVFFVICYFYQIVYNIVALIKKPQKHTGEKQHRFGIMIAARNEQAVIGNLIDSLNKQTYPRELYDIYVVADNCTDQTAEIARTGGAFVFERFNTDNIGKGYAMNYLFDAVHKKMGEDYYDGFLIFDADNLVDRHFIEEMNKAVGGEYLALTCYRNSKNIDNNWISSGSGIWFLHEAQFLNAPRYILGLSCAVSGTGFFLDNRVIKRNKGWHYCTLTEDIECSYDMVVSDEKIGYVKDAIIYDEQPTKFIESWNQRLRWAKGLIQVAKKYIRRLAHGILKKGDFSYFDMAMNYTPAIIITIFGTTTNIAILIFSLITGTFSWILLVTALLGLLGIPFLLMLAVGIITVISEWKSIRSSNLRKIWMMMTFPFFILTFMPLFFVAFFKKNVEWVQIAHTVDKTIDDMDLTNE